MQYLKVKKEDEFQKILSKGKRLYTPSFTLIFLDSQKIKMGISVGKRHGHAVQRNRIKRLFREAFRKNIFLMKEPHQFVVLPKVKESYSFFEFDSDLRKLIEKERL